MTDPMQKLNVLADMWSDGCNDDPEHDTNKCPYCIARHALNEIADVRDRAVVQIESLYGAK